MQDSRDYETVAEAPFKVTDDATATWAMRKLSAVQQKVDEAKAIYASEVARLDQWLADVTSDYQRSVDYFTALLTEYAIHERDAHDRKTVKLPHGEVKSRASAAKVVVDDLDLFVKWAEANGVAQVVRVKKEAAASEFASVFDIAGDKVLVSETGEVVEGVSVKPASVSFSVVVN